ncbi:hypothetical protein OC846_001281 [Tilletia horrida]|uniref:Thioesterase domain-containing protein n=1 Tax=Tilletia horrida TaxID=155126 RepID=A0AAN6GUB4_9BASI|nr:hypothetical protein OC846_001281 [Tilletia horrida]KAK0569417.1 hypothetical protein OC861_000905 [Tilletia horrida]
MDSASTTLHEQIQQLHLQLLSKSPIYNFLLQAITFHSLQPPPTRPTITTAQGPRPQASITASLPLTQIHLNSHHSLHGAVAATIVDWVGGIVIATLPRDADSTALTTPRGVSVDIHVRYLSAAAKLGDVLLIRAHSHKIGRNLAFVSVQLSVNKPKRKSSKGAADGQQQQQQQQQQQVEEEEEEDEEVCVVEASHTKYISSP